VAMKLPELSECVGASIKLTWPGPCSYIASLLAYNQWACLPHLFVRRERRLALASNSNIIGGDADYF
jgi:hypothetical protein